MISVREVQQLMSRGTGPSSRGGLGSVYQSGSSYFDSDTGHQLVPLGNGTYLDSVVGYVVDGNGVIVQSSAETRSGMTSGINSSPSSSGGDIGSLVRDIGGGIATGASIVRSILGQPAYEPPPQPWTTGEKVALGLAIGVPVLGLGAYAAGVFGGSPRRRRRR